jgi:hypothetical protein
VQECLTEWSKVKYGAMTKTINHLSKRLGQLQRMEHPGNLATIKQVQGKLNKLLEMEDIKWCQRAKRHWFKDGDRNTQYFHAWANQRRRSNQIGSTKDLEGQVWTQPEEIDRAFTLYFPESV